VFRTLSGKLIAALLILLGATIITYVGLTAVATRFYIQEINQSLNHSLAANIVESKPLIRKQQVNPEALDQVFEMLMKINPAIEVYLLSPAGQILAFSAPQEKIKRKQVSLAPIETFLAGDARLPIYGDDPRNPQRRKVFSAAPVHDQGRLQGYLYVVLGGESYDSVTAMFERSHVLRLTLAALVASLLLTATAGAAYFHWTTRRLRHLAKLMKDFRSSGLQRPGDVPENSFHARGDEIDRLEQIFDEMSQRIAEQIKELQSADSSRREMFANISHDLRTPLASLRGSVETLLMKQAELSEAEKQHYLNVALKHSEHLGRLTTELFELATLESADRKLHTESFSIAEIAQDVAQKFRPEAEQRHLKIECDLPPNTPLITADIGLIERVFENLIDNAIKYTPEGGTIRLSVTAGQNSVSAQVADTGCGIPASDLTKIFDRTYRTNKDRADRPRGTGLGLAIAQRILLLHGSSVEVESALGVGTIFRFTLPTTG
jgi:signal transduction histidine kinase